MAKSASEISNSFISLYFVVIKSKSFILSIRMLLSVVSKLKILRKRENISSE